MKGPRRLYPRSMPKKERQRRYRERMNIMEEVRTRQMIPAFNTALAELLARYAEEDKNVLIKDLQRAIDDLWPHRRETNQEAPQS